MVTKTDAPEGDRGIQNNCELLRSGLSVHCHGRAVNGLLDAALTYAGWGWHVVPVDMTTRRQMVCGGDAAATRDADLIRQRCQRYPGAGIAIAVAPSGLVVLDADRHGESDGVAALSELERQHGTLPAGPMAVTPSGGRHLYLRRPVGMAARRHIGVVTGLDVLAAGLVYAPPTRRPDGAYRWLAQPSGPESPELPEWVVGLVAVPERPPAPVTTRLERPEAVRPYMWAALVGEAQAVACAPEGERHKKLNAAAYTLGRLAAGCHAVGVPCFSANEASAVLGVAARACGLAGDAAGDWETSRTIQDGWAAGWSRPRSVAL